jgi:DNA-binding winged helix-turn-helix (wHTH) protein
MPDERSTSRQLGPAIFFGEFLSALRDDGLEIKFTRSESRLLAYMARNAERILTRNQLLDEISEPGSDKSDRNIDFTINRLRRKLNDDPKSPKFIATRYGEGYIWVAKAPIDRPSARGAHVVIGPVRGLGRIGNFESMARGFGHTFQSHLARHFIGHKVVLDPDCPPPASFGADCPKIGIDLTFIADDERLDCVFRATSFRTAKLLSVSRIRIADAAPTRPDRSAVAADALAEDIASQVWRSLAVQPELREPLPVQLHKASTNLAGGHHSWQESERRLRQALTERPNDPLLKLSLATAIHTKYLQAGMDLFAAGVDMRAADEAEIESLVTTALPTIESEPSLAVMAAKLLYFIDRGYRRMAVELAENANRSTTSVAATMAIVGQMRANVGQIDQALASLEQALELSEPDEFFLLYVLVMKAQAQQAASDRDGLDRTLARMYAIRSELRMFLEIAFTDHERPSSEALMIVEAATEARARGILLGAYYVNARLFQYEDHRENAMRTCVTLLTKRFGRGIVPREIAASVPGLMRA